MLILAAISAAWTTETLMLAAKTSPKIEANIRRSRKRVMPYRMGIYLRTASPIQSPGCDLPPLLAVTDQLFFFAFDLLYLNGEDTAQVPLIKRKERLQQLFKKEIHGLRYSERVVSDGPRFREHACKLGLEGLISKRIDRPYAPGDRGIWVKSKCLNREELIVVGWTDPEGSRSHLGALLLGYYTADGRLHYAGRAGTGITDKELKRLSGVLTPLQVAKMPLAELPPRDSRFGAPLMLSKVHWVKPEVVVEVTYLTWT